MSVPVSPESAFVTRVSQNTINAIRWSPVTIDTLGNPATVTSYKIYKTTYPNGLNQTLFKTVTTLDILGVVDTMTIDATIDPTMQYFYRVTAVSIAGEGDRSPEAADIS